MHFDMDSSLGFVLNRTSLLSKGFFNQRIRKYDITPEQWSLIFRVLQMSGLTQKELSDSTYKDQANITRSIDRLEKKGLLKRVPNDSDRRIINLYPTAEAIALAEEIIPVSMEFNRRLTAGFTPEEEDMLLQLLKKVHTNLEKEETHETVE
jgi:DNA-binding MarR family transcriptional regulator